MLFLCLEFYFSHLELRGSYFIKILQETGLEWHYWTTGTFSKSVVWCCLGVARLSVLWRLSVLPSVQDQKLRRFARLSVLCTLKRTYTSPEVQKSYFYTKTSNSSVLLHPNHPKHHKNGPYLKHGNN
jgi:hypothetical protein